MRDLNITINNRYIKAKNLDEDFASYVESLLERSNIYKKENNNIEKLFHAFLSVALENYEYRQEIKAIIED